MTAENIRDAGTDPPEQVDMRPLMAGFPTGVCVVTTVAADGTPWGMTCTSLCSVSLDPPTLLVCLRCGSPTLDAITAVGSFAINLLHDRARPVAQLFASGAADRFDRVTWRTGDEVGAPHLFDAAHTIADCVVADASVVGTHTVIMGGVARISQLRDQQPLLYGLRRYENWPETDDASRLHYDFIS
jgi:flavin reductase (DIM6/NTAB) family NADH-FMN oxidoreductase RutF